MYAPNFNICSYISAKIIPRTLSMLQNKITPKDFHGTIMLHLLQAKIKIKSAPNPDCININVTYFDSGGKEQKTKE